MQLADYDDVETLAGYSPDLTRVEHLLDLAGGLVAAEMGYTELPAPVPTEVRLVTAGAVVRALNNPNGVLQDTAGPFTVRYADDTEPGLYLTQAERQRLSRARGGPPSIRGLWSLRTTRGDGVYGYVEEYDPFLEGWPS